MVKTKTKALLKEQHNIKQNINWSAYTESLVNRGRFSIWIDEAALYDPYKDLYAQPIVSSLGGRPRIYSDALILLTMTLKELYHLKLRQTEGFFADMLKLLKLNLKTPDYTTLCRRSKELQIDLKATQVKRDEPLVVLIDSTGVKVMGEGEWKIRLHGKSKMKLYRKVHFALDHDSQDIIGVTMSDANIQDADAVPELVRQVDTVELKLGEIIADGAYDRHKTYRLASKHHARLIAPPEPRATIRRDDPVLQIRNDYVKDIRLCGKDVWKQKVNYHRRSLIETAMYRLKSTFTDEMRSRTDANQLTTMSIRARILNRFNDMNRTNGAFMT